MNGATRLWHTDRNGRRFLMSTITSSSWFKGFNAPKDLGKPENRFKCAEIIRDGWIQCGQMNDGTWEIEEGKRDPIVFSKMTNEILMKGREDVF